MSGCWTKALAVGIPSTRCIKDVLLVINPIRRAKEKDVFLTIFNKNRTLFFHGIYIVKLIIYHRRWVKIFLIGWTLVKKLAILWLAKHSSWRHFGSTLRILWPFVDSKIFPRISTLELVGASEVSLTSPFTLNLSEWRTRAVKWIAYLDTASGRNGSSILNLTFCSLHCAASTVCRSNRAIDFSTKGWKFGEYLNWCFSKQTNKQTV